MEEMKYDMCGGATVFGIMKAVATLGIKKNIKGIVGAVENMPSGKATKPGDVITMMSGKTVEVTNTDAEGRMVLADLLTYVGEKYDASTVIDFATLTGACCVALGDHAAGIFTEDDELADRLYAAGQNTNDKCWRLPIWEEYNKQMDSDFADVGNTGSKGAGASTAACFLNRFASEYDYKYVHMDIAGVAWSKKATGRPVKMMMDFLSSDIY
jgi:leucyl aminopeptidase